MATQKEIIEIEITGVNESVKDIQKVDNALKGVDNEIDNISDSSKNLKTNLDKVDKGGKDASKGLKAVGENGGAIAVLDSLTGGLATKVRDTAEATKLFNFSLKGTKTALIATGIGAFVVALGLVVAYWDDIVELITGANKQLQKQIDLNNENLESLDFELKLLDEKSKILELEGKSTEEINKQKEATILLQQEQNALLLDNLKTQLQREQAQVKELTFWERLKIGAASALNPVQGQLQEIKAGLASEDEQTKLKEIQDQIDDATLRTLTLKTALLELNKPDEEDVDSETGERREQLTPLDRIDEALIVAEGLEQVEIDSNFKKLQAQTEYQLARRRTDELITANEKAENEKRLANDRLIQRQKLDLAIRGFDALSQILGENSKAGKAAAIASIVTEQIASISQIISNTGIANAKAVAASPLTLGQPFVALNTISAGISIASSVAGAAKAISQLNSNKQTPSQAPALKGGGRASAPSIPTETPQAQAPSFNITDTTGVNQLAESIGGQSQRPVRTFVVASDVTTAQNLDNNIIEGAVVG
jgi:hypothetical protein